MTAGTSGTPLAQYPCQLVCTWDRTGQLLDGLPLFRCVGCRSEWVRTEAWTPAGADGVVDPQVAAEAARRRPATTGRGGGAAGSGGS